MRKKTKREELAQKHQRGYALIRFQRMGGEAGFKRLVQSVFGGEWEEGPGEESEQGIVLPPDLELLLSKRCGEKEVNIIS